MGWHIWTISIAQSNRHRGPSIFDDIGLNLIPQSASDVSWIYSELFGRYRHWVMCGGLNPSCDVIPPDLEVPQDPPDPQDSFSVLGKGDHSSFLHVAVILTDVPMAYECIRLGTMVNRQDAKGRTPLLFTLVLILDAMWTFWGSQEGLDTLPGRFRFPSLPPDLMIQTSNPPRTRLVSSLRARPDNGNSSTCFSSMAQILPPQGSPNLVSLFSDFEVQEHLTELLAAHVNPKRPERLCPCFSGKTLARCHAARAQPYPKGFICRCGSGKPYGKCCLKRSALLSEGWSDEKQKLVVGGVWLSRATFDSRNIDPELCRVLDAFSDYVRRRRPDEAFIRARAAAELRHVGDIIDTLSREGLGDVAFIAVMKKLSPYIVMPYENTLSKVGCENAAKAWNDSVDLYIETRPASIDVRPRIEIEKVAKVANDGGPLYKRCEASGCLAVEGVDGAKMKICTGCKRLDLVLNPVRPMRQDPMRVHAPRPAASRTAVSNELYLDRSLLPLELLFRILASAIQHRDACLEVLHASIRVLDLSTRDRLDLLRVCCRLTSMLKLPNDLLSLGSKLLQTEVATLHIAFDSPQQFLEHHCLPEPEASALTTPVDVPEVPQVQVAVPVRLIIRLSYYITVVDTALYCVTQNTDVDVHGMYPATPNLTNPYASTSVITRTMAVRACIFLQRVRPYENTLPKVGCEKAAKAWNDSVDLYIETIPKSIDARPRIEIEKVAKVANDGGPLYKRCEATGCMAAEGVDGAKMKKCTGCKRILYCGSACQAADWSQHKAKCKNGSHPLQMLPSQAEFRAQLDGLLRESLKKIQKMQNMEEAFRGDVSAAAGISLAFTVHAIGVQQGFTSGADGVGGKS
ncbi:predicted protein [Postia placenta Mad-698-R]|nr:predicted protein [Postia placenta Mad-698-R]